MPSKCPVNEANAGRKFIRPSICLVCDLSLITCSHLHGVLYGACERPGVEHAGASEQAVVFVVEGHAVDTSLTGPLLVIREHLQAGERVNVPDTEHPSRRQTNDVLVLLITTYVHYRE